MFPGNALNNKTCWKCQEVILYECIKERCVNDHRIYFHIDCYDKDPFKHENCARCDELLKHLRYLMPGMLLNKFSPESLEDIKYYHESKIEHNLRFYKMDFRLFLNQELEYIKYVFKEYNKTYKIIKWTSGVCRNNIFCYINNLETKVWFATDPFINKCCCLKGKLSYGHNLLNIFNNNKIFINYIVKLNNIEIFDNVFKNMENIEEHFVSSKQNLSNIWVLDSKIEIFKYIINKFYQKWSYHDKQRILVSSRVSFDKSSYLLDNNFRFIKKSKIRNLVAKNYKHSVIRIYILNILDNLLINIYYKTSGFLQPIILSYVDDRQTHLDFFSISLCSYCMKKCNTECCKYGYYCSKKCQRSHFEIHRYECEIINKFHGDDYVEERCLYPSAIEFKPHCKYNFKR